MDAKLLCIDGLHVDGEIPLERFPLAIGRNPSADLLIDDSSVSRFHCVIDQVDGGLVVRDLGSRMGTMVNGLKVGVSPLMPGDDLSIGVKNFRAVYSPANAAESRSSTQSASAPRKSPRSKGRWSLPVRRARVGSNSRLSNAKRAFQMFAALGVTIGARLLTSLHALPHFARQHS